MLRDKDQPGEDGYMIRTWIMDGGAKEFQEASKYMPDSVDLPVTHELFVESGTLPDGRKIKRQGVRRKASGAPMKADESDELDKLDDGALEVLAAKAGLDVPAFRKLGSKARKVKAIRDKQAAGE